MRDPGLVLLDAETNTPVVDEIREVIASSPIKAAICDLHVWQVGKGKCACILSPATDVDVPPDHFKAQLRVHESACSCVGGDR